MKHQAHKLETLVGGEAKSNSNARTRFIAITSGKGGVGKTTIGANLGYLLANRGYKVGLFDADIGLANLDVMLGIKAQKTILHLLRGECQIEDIVLPVSENCFLIPGESGSEILRFGETFMMERFYSEIKKLNFLDYLILDTGAGIGENVQMFLGAADEIVVVTVPDPAAITDAYAMIKVLSATKSRLFMILNQAQNEKEGAKVFEKVKKVALSNMPDLELILAGSILKDDEIAKSVRTRRLFAIDAPNGKAAAKLEQIIDCVLRTMEHILLDEKKVGGFEYFFKKLLHQF
ncbi:MAG: MinD/ParA family protein [Helicobacteraceae bacterium]|nr:MinD/ParA family protein [Helicobacteraceae bacterium]